MTAAEPFIEQAAARSEGYWLLSRLFLEPPGAALLGHLSQVLAQAEAGEPAVQADMDFLGEAVRQSLADPESAAVAFTRYLVVLPKGSLESLPFESHFLEGATPGAATAALLQRMADWGYAPVLAPSAPPDHLGAELRLMAVLCNAEREAWQQGDRAAAMQHLERQHELLGCHLAAWAPDYCAALAGRAENAYVQAIARITASTLRADVAVLEGIRREAGHTDSGAQRA